VGGSPPPLPPVPASLVDVDPPPLPPEPPVPEPPLPPPPVLVEPPLSLPELATVPLPPVPPPPELASPVPPAPTVAELPDCVGSPLPDVVVEPAVVLDPLLGLLVGGDELPPLAVLPELLDSAEEVPWLGLVLATELAPIASGSPSESLEHDTTSAGRTTHRVAEGNVDNSSLLMGGLQWTPAIVSSGRILSENRAD
jgi:hypothetical protein